MAREAEEGGERLGRVLRGLLGILVLLVVPPAAAAASPAASFPGDVNGHSLHPPYFNLAEGTRISATATCGEEAVGAGSRRAVEDLYCKLVGGPLAGGDPNQTIQGQYCDICSSANSNKAHPITNAIDGTERWWQSPPLSRGLEFNQVNVTLDLGQAVLGGAQPFGGAQWELPLILPAAYDADALPEQLAPKKTFPESSWKHLTVTESRHLKPRKSKGHLSRVLDIS